MGEMRIALAIRYAAPLLLLPCFATASPAFGLHGSRPNILLWLLDDWSYELWPGVEKQDELNTNRDGTPAFTQSAASMTARNDYDVLLPNVNSTFVSSGVALRTFYTFQICSPSRRSLLLGRFMSTVGKPYGSDFAMQVQASTVADRLKSAGYSTHHIGKWHAGYNSWSVMPTGRGFDTAMGFHSQSIEQFEYHPRAMSEIDGWPDDNYGLTSADVALTASSTTKAAASTTTTLPTTAILPLPTRLAFLPNEH